MALAAAPAIEVGFSPEGEANRLVLSVIDNADESIRLSAYPLTSPGVVSALMRAEKEGVDVSVIVDWQANQSKKAQIALRLLSGAGVPVRLVSAYKIMHDKYIVADNKTVETGSFNYTMSAAKKNSENVIVLHDQPEVAAQYLAHWKNRWAQGEDYSTVSAD